MSALPEIESLRLKMFAGLAAGALAASDPVTAETLGTAFLVVRWAHRGEKAYPDMELLVGRLSSLIGRLAPEAERLNARGLAAALAGAKRALGDALASERTYRNGVLVMGGPEHGEHNERG